MINKQQALLLLALSLIAHAPAQAAQKTGDLGLGVVLGDPTAITVKQYLQKGHAYDVGFGYDWGHSVVLYADYLFHFPGALKTSSPEVNSIAPYVGVGPQIDFYDNGYRRYHNGSSSSTALSMRIPLGLSWLIPDSPLEVFGELVPTLILVPGLTTDINGGVGIRYFF